MEINLKEIGSSSIKSFLTKHSQSLAIIFFIVFLAFIIIERQ